MTFVIRVEPEVLPSIAKTIDILGRLHEVFSVDCQQQIDDLTSLLMSAGQERKLPELHSVSVDSDRWAEYADYTRKRDRESS